MTAILVVERDRSICDFMTETLEMGLIASVECAHSGASGLKAIEGGCFDLAILDASLPEVSGFELARRAANRNIPALLCSDDPVATMQLKALNLPHLLKPFHADELISSAAQILILNKANLRRINASLIQLRATVAALEVDLATSRQLIEKSRALVDRANKSDRGALSS